MRPNIICWTLALAVIAGAVVPIAQAAAPPEISPVQLEIYRRRAKSGELAVQVLLAEAYHFGLGIRVDPIQARYWAAEAASRKSARAMALHAFLMHHGYGGQKTLEKARLEAKGCLKDLKEEAASGDSTAQAWLAWILSEDIAEDRDPTAAFKAAAASAKSGNPFGQNLAGTFYCGGFGVEADNAEGALWYRAAADQRFAGAQYNLGRLYAYAPKMKDPSEAIKWWTLAAEQNHPGAQLSLGTAYEEGLGVTADLVSAAVWYSLAQPEEAEAVRRLGALLPKLSTEDLAAVNERFNTMRTRLRGQ